MPPMQSMGDTAKAHTAVVTSTDRCITPDMVSANGCESKEMWVTTAQSRIFDHADGIAKKHHAPITRARITPSPQTPTVHRWEIRRIQSSIAFYEGR